MSEFDLQVRNKIARRILQLRDACASAVTDELYALPAACSQQFGEDGRRHCRNDLAFHIQFLAAGMEANSLTMFRRYLKWCDGLLASRGVECEPAAQTAERIAARLSQMLAPNEASVLSEFLSGCDDEEGERNELESSNVPERLRGAREAYVSALLAGERFAALTVAEQCLHEVFALTDVYVEVLAGALHQIGELWEGNRITVAHEHVATAITQMVIADLCPRIPRGETSRGKVVVAGVSGEMHQVGANLLSDALQAGGWKVTFLGSNVPDRALLDMLAASDPDFFCLSTTLAAHLPAAADLIRQVRDRFGPRRPEIMVGGAAFNQSPAVYIKNLGVRFADLRGAVRLLCPEEWK